MTDDVLQRLASLISSRRGDRAGKSYTKELLDGGPERCAKKLGEEAVETVIAAMGRMIARCTARPPICSIICWSCSKQAGDAHAVLGELDGRMGTSGLAEKAARAERQPQ